MKTTLRLKNEIEGKNILIQVKLFIRKRIVSPIAVPILTQIPCLNCPKYLAHFAPICSM